MTYNAGATKSGPYDTDGVQTVFAYGFKCYAKTDIEAIYTTAAGAESTIDPSGYSMDGFGNDSGGNVTFTGAPTGGGKVTFRLAPPKEQQVNLRNQGPYTPETVERMGDRLAMLIFSLAEEVGRSVKVDISSGIDSTDYLEQAQMAANSSAANADVAGAYATAAGGSASAAASSAAAAAAAGAGLKYKDVRAATTANGALATAFANGQVIDGITLVTGDRILLKNQSAAAENGVYTVNASGAPTRATDMDIWVEVVSSVVIVSVGTTNANSVWLCTSNDGGTLGSTAITFINYGSTIVDGTITLAKLASISANTLVGNVSGATATPIATVITPNTFLARGSSGNIATKTITDFGLSLVASASASDAGIAITGEIKDFAMASPPTGYLVCDGSAVSRSSYSNLFAAIGTIWGNGDGSTTFNLPNLQRRTRVGSGGPGTATLANTVGSYGGSETHTLTVNEIPPHQHFVANGVASTSGGLNSSNTLNAASAGGLGNGDYNLQGSGNTATAALSSSTGGGASHNNMQPSAVVLTCIKT